MFQRKNGGEINKEIGLPVRDFLIFLAKEHGSLLKNLFSVTIFGKVTEMEV